MTILRLSTTLEIELDIKPCGALVKVFIEQPRVGIQREKGCGMASYPLHNFHV
ncbi:hypothetical protein SRABI26_01701 [Arthrobacter sp. Bi26]|nr:hypothetical protein SRABI26_01701 [Arthrobacter sp. Bi26]